MGGGDTGGRWGGIFMHNIHVGGFCFCKTHMGTSQHFGRLKHRPAAELLGGGVGRPDRRPALWPADSAVGNFTFGRADTAAEPHRCAIPMS